MYKIKVLTLVPASYGGGAEHLVLDQLRYYNKNLVEYRVIALRKENDEEKFAEHEEYMCINSKKKFELGALVRLNNIIKRKKIQIVHTHLIQADIYGFLLKILNPRVKWVTTKHNNDEFRKKLFWRTLNKIISTRNDKIIAVSNSVRNFVINHEWISPRKIVTLTNGIDSERFKRLSGKNVRKEYGIKDNDFVVGIVGRLNYQKGHIYLFKAAQSLEKRIKNLKIVVIGEGELGNKLKSKCRELGIEKKVIFGGFRKDTEHVYNSFDIFCLPSLFEGLPLVLIEAMACERMCICSDIPNNREVVDNGKDGILIGVGDINKITEEIYKAYKNPKRRVELGRNARKKVLEKFEFRNNLSHIEKVYMKTVNQK